MFGKRKIATLVAEFLGTGILTLLILSVQRSTIGVPFFVALAGGLTLMALVFAFGGVSGAYTNPAITLAMWTARKIGAVQAALYIIVEFLGAWASYALYHYYVNANVQSVAGHLTLRILVAEAVATAIFGFIWAAAVYQGYSRGVTAAVAGIGYTIAIIAASSAAVGIANPAVALGVRAVNVDYILGPVLGAVFGVNLYGLLFATPEALVSSEATVASFPPVVSSDAVLSAPKPGRKPRTVKAAATATKPKTTRTRRTSTASTTRRPRTATTRRPRTPRV